GLAQDAGEGVVVEQATDAAEPRLQGLYREPLEGAGEVDPGGDGREGDEADERQGQLPGDAPPEEVNTGGGHAGSPSNREPTDLIVAIRLPASPSFARRRRTCTSTVRDSISSARA